MTLNYVFPWFMRTLSAANPSQQLKFGEYRESPNLEIVCNPIMYVFIFNTEHTNVNLLYLITLVV